MEKPIAVERRESVGPILLVEDDADQRAIYSSLLRKRGYEVLEAEHGEQALSVISESGKPALIVCDLMMPVMDGLELVGALRREDDYAELPVLMLSAVDSPDTQRELIEAGANSYCSKQSGSRELLKRIREFVG